MVVKTGMISPSDQSAADGATTPSVLVNGEFHIDHASRGIVSLAECTSAEKEMGRREKNCLLFLPPPEDLHWVWVSVSVGVKVRHRVEGEGYTHVD